MLLQLAHELGANRIVLGAELPEPVQALLRRQRLVLGEAGALAFARRHRGRAWSDTNSLLKLRQRREAKRSLPSEGSPDGLGAHGLGLDLHRAAPRRRVQA